MKTFAALLLTVGIYLLALAASTPGEQWGLAIAAGLLLRLFVDCIPYLEIGE